VLLQAVPSALCGNAVMISVVVLQGRMLLVAGEEDDGMMDPPLIDAEKAVPMLPLTATKLLSR